MFLLFFLSLYFSAADFQQNRADLWPGLIAFKLHSDINNSDLPGLEPAQHKLREILSEVSEEMNKHCYIRDIIHISAAPPLHDSLIICSFCMYHFLIHTDPWPSNDQRHCRMEK